MRTTTTVAVLRHEQADPDVWAAVERVIAAWESKGGVAVARDVEFLRHVELSDDAARDELVERLEAVGAVLHVVRRDVLEPVDYESADYVGVFGTDLGPAFVSNADAAIVDRGPCPECGEHDALDVDQVGAFEVDEACLDRPAVDGSSPGRRGWQVVGLPGGGLGVSHAVAARLSGLTGVTLRDLIADGVPSRRIVQIEADRTVLVPCREHTEVEGAPHCPVCGRARSQMHGYFWVSPAQTAGRDLLSAHPGGRAFLHASRRAMAVLEPAPAGLLVSGVMRLCEH